METCVNEVIYTVRDPVDKVLNMMRAAIQGHDMIESGDTVVCAVSVSYTHLDVYKRQYRESLRAWEDGLAVQVRPWVTYLQVWHCPFMGILHLP